VWNSWLVEILIRVQSQNLGTIQMRCYGELFVKLLSSDIYQERQKFCMKLWETSWGLFKPTFWWSKMKISRNFSSNLVIASLILYFDWKKFNDWKNNVQMLIVLWDGCDKLVPEKRLDFFERSRNFEIKKFFWVNYLQIKSTIQWFWNDFASRFSPILLKTHFLKSSKVK